MLGKDYLKEPSYNRNLRGSGQTTDATKTTILSIPIPQDAAVHLIVDVAAIMSLLSNFTGANKADNQGFDAGIGDWAQGTGGVLASAAGGQAGNGGQYTVGAAPSITLMSLASGLTNLVVGKRYRLTFYMKLETAWGGGNVTCTIDGQTVVHTPTASYVQKTLDFTASGTSPTIAFTCAGAPTLNDILWIDTFELTEIGGASYERGASYKNAGGTVIIIGTITSRHEEEDRDGWLCALEINGTNVEVNVTGEASATIDWYAEARRRFVKF